MTNTCYSYIIDYKDYIFPSYDIFNNLCLTYDKTRLFIVSLIRVLIYVYLLDITNNWDLENKEIKNILIYSLHTMIIINIFYLIFVMLKNVKNTKYIKYNN